MFGRLSVPLPLPTMQRKCEAIKGGLKGSYPSPPPASEVKCSSNTYCAQLLQFTSSLPTPKPADTELRIEVCERHGLTQGGDFSPWLLPPVSGDTEVSEVPTLSILRSATATQVHGFAADCCWPGASIVIKRTLEQSRRQ